LQTKDKVIVEKRPPYLFDFMMLSPNKSIESLIPWR